jgi:hypothetical protein
LQWRRRRGGQKALERGFVTGVLLGAPRPGDEPADAVDDKQHRIRQLGGRAARARSQLDQEIFEPVGEPAHPHHADHAGCPFHGVRFPKDGVDGSLIVRSRLEHEQPGGDALEVTLGLLDEQRPELVF